MVEGLRTSALWSDKNQDLPECAKLWAELEVIYKPNNEQCDVVDSNRSIRTSSFSPLKDHWKKNSFDSLCGMADQQFEILKVLGNLQLIRMHLIVFRLRNTSNSTGFLGGAG
jgi:hypothetical protein